MRALLLLAFVPVVALAQLRLYVAPPNSEIPVGGSYDLGSIPAGDILETRFRVRNHGTASAAINSVSVGGVGFSMPTPASLPFLVAPGLNYDFTVRFQAREHGQYSANLAVNGISVLLRATALAAAVVRANGSTVGAGASIDFGRVERGRSAEISFEIANITTQTVTVRSVQLNGAAFRSNNLPAPAELAGSLVIPFSIRFEPAAAGVFTGSLVIDGREFRLTGAASEPPFTRPSVVLDSAVTESARQGRISVRFGSPSRAAGTGRLRIDFQPAAGTADNDAAIQFPGSGNRTISFTVAEGDTEARFGDTTQAVFQTGTTVGNIVLTAEIGGFTEQTTVPIAASAVRFDQSTAIRSGGSLEVQVTGFDNTHSGSELTFTFFDRAGTPVQPGAIRANAREDFRRYFESSRLGGTFALRATFPVAGNAAEIEGVEVEFVNAAGSAKTARLRF